MTMPSDSLIEEKFEEETGVIGGNLASCFDDNFALLSPMHIDEYIEIIGEMLSIVSC